MAYIRRIIITDQRYVQAMNCLKDSSSIRGLWGLPGGLLLFESYYPVYERLYNVDRCIALEARENAGTQRELRDAINAEHELLAPLFRGKPPNFQGSQFFLPGRTSFAIYMGEEALHLPALQLYEGWETTGAMMLKLCLAEAGRPNADLDALVSGWSESAMAHGRLESMTRMYADAPILKCSFSSPAFDAVCALHRLLSPTDAVAPVERIERLREPL